MALNPLDSRSCNYSALPIVKSSRPFLFDYCRSKPGIGSVREPQLFTSGTTVRRRTSQQICWTEACIGGIAYPAH